MTISIYVMVPGVGVGVGGESWVDQRIPQAYIQDAAQVKGPIDLLPSQNPFMSH